MNAPIAKLNVPADDTTQPLAGDTPPCPTPSPAGARGEPGTPSEARANATAARIAAREAYAHCVRTGSERHWRALAEYHSGERDWPWPDPTPEETWAADGAVFALGVALIDDARLTDAELVGHSKDQRKFKRGGV